MLTNYEDQDQNILSMYTEYLPLWLRTGELRHEKGLNVFHLRCLRKILGISWQAKVTNNEILIVIVCNSNSNSLQ